MENEKELIKINARDITPTGKQVLNAIHLAYKPKEAEVDGYEQDEESGTIALVKKTAVLASPMSRLNKGVSPEVFVMFADMVQPEDQQRIQGIIESGTLNVIKAVKVFQCVQLIADKRTLPKTWKQSFEMASPSIASIVKYKGEEKAALLIYSLLFPFAQSFGKRNDLSENDITNVSEHIVAHYRRLTITDIKMILNDASTISKSRFNLDVQGIKALFYEADTEKQEAGANIAIDEHARETASEKDPRSHRQPSLKQSPKAMAVMADYYQEQKRNQE